MSLLTWITGYDTENADRAAAADAELRRLNEAQYTGATLDAVRANYASQEAIGRDAQTAQINQAFGEGWQQGQNNVSAFVGRIFGVVGDVLKAVLFGIPFWVWLLAGLFLAWRLGLLGKVLKKVKA